MTRKAIQLLDNKKGFFLQVEGASIDKQDHAANACGQLGETVAFDDAIGVAEEYQRHRLGRGSLGLRTRCGGGARHQRPHRPVRHPQG
ncbi:MAG TPA: alkaline phosphatase [Thermoleophilaceae bacterium]|jgi:hypothetical protein